MIIELEWFVFINWWKVWFHVTTSYEHLTSHWIGLEWSVRDCDNRIEIIEYILIRHFKNKSSLFRVSIMFHIERYVAINFKVIQIRIWKLIFILKLITYFSSMRPFTYYTIGRGRGLRRLTRCLRKLAGRGGVKALLM